MKPKDLWIALDLFDDGQEDCEPVSRVIPGLTAGDVRYLKSLVEDDETVREQEAADTGHKDLNPGHEADRQ